MNNTTKIAAGLAIAFGTNCFAPAALAGKKFEVDQNTWASIGAGIRMSYGWRDTDRHEWAGSRDFQTENFRLYFNAQLNDWLKLNVNTDKDNSNDDWIRLLDAVIKLEFHELINVWAGRLLIPVDRSSIDGPYNTGTWRFPIVAAYPSIWKGRDNGAAVWGQVDGGRFKYQLGAFEGCKDSHPCDNGHDAEDPLFAGRLTYNFWDPEPGYFNRSDYYGEKEILAIGIAGAQQSDAAGTKADPGDFTAGSVDFLLQDRFKSNGVFTMEAAYYDYDRDNKASPSLLQGDGAMFLSSYLIPQTIGYGRFQPTVRYQRLAANGTTRKVNDVGVNYIIDGHKARLSLIGSRDRTAGSKRVDSVIFGVQLQY